MDDRERAQQAEKAAELAVELTAGDVRGVALTFVDTSGITRSKAVPVARLEHAAAWGVGASPCFDTFLLDDSIVPARFTGGVVGDLRLHPVLDRLTPLSALPGWAWAPAARYAQDGTAHPVDGRTVLRRAAGRLADEGLTVRAAFEVEWTISQGGPDEFVPACHGPAYGMARLTEQAGYLSDLLEALAASGVAVEQIHPEYAAGQYEVSVAAEEPVGAADTTVLVRETIRAVSQAHGLRASFSPKVAAGAVGNGGHVHLSLWRDGRNLMAGGAAAAGMTGTGEAFAAGILERLPALLALGAPSVASYLRLVPSHWAGAYACWGPENREAALRFITGPAGSSAQAANLEVKCFDATANPCFALAGLLAAGSAGITEGRTLPAPVAGDPALAAEAGRPARLPSSLEEAVRAFEGDPVLRAALGEAVIDTVAAVRRGEIALFAGATDEEIVAATRYRH
ncbi:glutamine synthetase family protein [Actinomadura macrotermitis]|uniref:Glutamine synthetase n=1 Tax=Actinomadura macrotermitis TaxID=2585200 RepID=A0A7K0C992_9ACTN|nr:glutamine synthetase family protein [Actinomadura macrotermitis]MQY09354.1 Glutamine synthetase [Actinomadura macrotermitis]